MIWIIDNGHGPLQAGKRSPRHTDGTQLLEYEFNRGIAVHLLKLLREAGIPCHELVPDYMKLGAALTTRVTRAKAVAARSQHKPILVSIHGNAHGDGNTWTNANGIEVFYNKSAAADPRLANTFQDEIVKATRFRDRGIKYNHTFQLLKSLDFPVLLTENGFYTNLVEFLQMRTSAFQHKVAEAHFRAIQKIEEFG